MTNDQQLTNEKSMDIIHQMINQAKNNYSENGLSWLLWGIMLFITSVCTYIFIDIGSSNLFLAWNIFGGISVILLIYHSITKPAKKPVRTYIDDILKLVDIGFVTCMAVLIFAINYNAVTPRIGFAFFLMIFAFLMLVRGGAIKSKSLVVGAVVNWAGTIAIFMVKEFKYAMLIMAVAVLIGYIIPGLLLRAEYKKKYPEK